jgi:hypothetical protein
MVQFNRRHHPAWPGYAAGLAAQRRVRALELADHRFLREPSGDHVPDELLQVGAQLFIWERARSGATDTTLWYFMRDACACWWSVTRKSYREPYRWGVD